ncbi:FlaD/FlaE family flagellar protein [Halogranum rubrum]|uniref:Archaeal flagella protein FlaD/E domain-containing protein n=1 Tax=Halogranum salarium B-1 TaxID=1210908 RepID=J3EYB2_9EURY|nr:FlaD/FlaE family flagellar protein [Halogranum salarium]EJN60292.1 hypothetical protein HSB1_08950 [Halogranum salarium B-1]
MDVLAPHQTLSMAFGGWGELTLVVAWWQLESIPANVGISSALLLSVGLVGSAILDRFFGDDEASDESESLMGEDSLDGGDGFDDFDDVDGMDGWDDPFGDGGDEGGESTDELDHRLSELEDEVARLSSTVNTVRSENTEISGTVDDIGENVRKLLDIYEMVTRGINPFVDDVQPGGSGGFDEGSLGLFDDSGGGDEEDDLDDSVTSADAEGFFDEELLDDSDDEFDGDDVFADDGDELDETEVTEEMETEITNGGKSFSELKDEYESGEAEWADDDFGFDGDEEADAEASAGIDAEAMPEVDDEDGLFGETLGDTDVAESTDESTTDFGSLEEVEMDTESDPTPDAADEGGFEFGNTAESTEADGDEASGLDEAADAKPYLTALPDSYVGDLLVIEWMEYLVEDADVADAARAIRYYERIDWVASDVARTLEQYLVGFGRASIAEGDRSGSMELSRSHHVRSLDYVQALSGDPHGGVSRPLDALGRTGLSGFTGRDAARDDRRLRHDGGEDGL